MLGGRDPAEALIRDDGRVVSVGEFLALAGRLAASLTPGSTVLNLCERRPAFLAAYAGALRAGCTTLLPASRAPEVVSEVRALYPGSVTLDDMQVAAHGAAAAAAGFTPASVAADLVAMIGFTSGSTGQPSRHEKVWRVVAASTAHNAARLRAALPQDAADRLPWIVGTVPPQHMYGMEMTVLLPLLGGMALHGGRPLLPTEVAAALAAVPQPRILVSTAGDRCRWRPAAARCGDGQCHRAARCRASGRRGSGDRRGIDRDVRCHRDLHPGIAPHRARIRMAALSWRAPDR